MLADDGTGAIAAISRGGVPACENIQLGSKSWPEPATSCNFRIDGTLAAARLIKSEGEGTRTLGLQRDRLAL